ncbi:hypothetical protein [Streptomyces sp. AC495_CC817]|uniref:hypothetical protein n=1 Tax=Streptomyces sp. AC495_CC817 TaxID=2823900 RepID=UPI001C2690C8|nr:hypothetical protein [Streptomyces sp. AC495_CC817]
MTPAYENGQYPLSLFIHRGGNLYFTPSLNARWDEMVRLAIEKYGVRLFITGDIDGLGGWNVYRPLLPQRRYKAYYGKQAAAEGFSSHGGKYQGKVVFALDIANVDALAPGNPSLAHARLTALAKAVGLTVNFVTPTEWWHVGDFNPAWTAPTFGRVTINPTTTAMPTRRKKKMSTIYRKQEGDLFTYALAGESPGTSANWLETTDKDLARNWGLVHGTAVPLNPRTTWGTYRAQYLEPVRTR